jgi:hypothetical protein
MVSMRKLQVLEDIEQMEDEIDLKEALIALKNLKSGKDNVVSWSDVKKDFAI